MSPQKRALLDELMLAVAMTAVVRFLLPEAILWLVFLIAFAGFHLGLNKKLQEKSGQSLGKTFRENISRKDVSLALAWVLALLVHVFIGLSMWLAVPIVWVVIYFAFKDPMSADHI